MVDLNDLPAIAKDLVDKLREAAVIDRTLSKILGRPWKDPR